MMMQKGDLLIRLFSTLYRVRISSWIFSQLNILCANLQKPHWNKNNHSPVIHCLHVTAILRVVQPTGFHRSSELHISERSLVQYFIRRKNCVLNFATVTYSLHKCSETKLCWKSESTVYASPVFQRIGVLSLKQKNLPSSSSDLSLVNFLLWEVLQQKLYRQDFRDLDHLKHVLLHCWVRVIRRNKTGARPTAERAVMVSRVHSRHVEFLLTYWCS